MPALGLGVDPSDVGVVDPQDEQAGALVGEEAGSRPRSARRRDGAPRSGSARSGH